MTLIVQSALDPTLVSAIQAGATNTVSPTITAIGYLGDDTATDIAGGQTITLTGTNFKEGVTVLIGNVQVNQITRISATQLTFIAPANTAGSYIIYVVNTDGSSAISVPGLQYSGVPAWTTTAGSLGTPSTSVSFTATLAATGDAPISYLVVSGALPPGINLNTVTGVISGTTPSVTNSTTYNFTVRATDAQNQDTNRAFSLTVAPLTTIAVDYLIVGGGGGGHSQGGGGGGGGYVNGSSNITMGQAYTITVGNGGAALNSNTYDTIAASGSSSSISGIGSANGGGGGGLGQGGSGGSGGGGKGAYTVVGYGGYGSQGFSGGAGPSYSGSFNNHSAAGGGGGAGGQGAQGNAGGPNPSTQSGGNGGPGKTWLDNVTYAPGGGGSGDPYYSAAAGSTGAGVGIGAGGSSGGSLTSGGTGIVVIRYLATLPAASSVSGATTSTSGGYRYYYFNYSGSITF
jgi:hypothetical protein